AGPYPHGRPASAAFGAPAKRPSARVALPAPPQPPASEDAPAQRDPAAVNGTSRAHGSSEFKRF
ncbi:MAG TPA: hypothetical protein VIV57_22935, partial [Anaeromyxobacter sp.]